MGGEFGKLAGCVLVKMQVELSRISCTTANRSYWAPRFILARRAPRWAWSLTADIHHVPREVCL
jgi:hypothetical protein